MKKVLALLVIALTSLSLPAEIHDSSLAQGARLVADPKTFVLDVRNPDEYAEGRLAGAVLIPVKKLSHQLDQLPRDKNTPLLVYCAGGVRSRTAAKFLEKKGYKNIYDLREGMWGWRKEKRPVVQ